MTKEEAAQANKKILSTKITQDQFDHLSKMSKQLGFSSPYELMQTIAAVLVKYDKNAYNPSETNYNQICAFIEPFLEIDDFRAYTQSYLAEAEFGSKKTPKESFAKKCPIEYIVVRNGKLVSKFFRDENGNPKITHCADSIILDLLKALRPWVHDIVIKAMQAMKTASFIEWVRQSIQDQAEDIKAYCEAMQCTMSGITYGNVPKQKRNRFDGHEGFGNHVNEEPFKKSKDVYRVEEQD